MLQAKELLEKEHSIKLRLIEGARDLKRQLIEALQVQRRDSNVSAVITNNNQDVN